MAKALVMRIQRRKKIGTRIPTGLHLGTQTQGCPNLRFGTSRAVRTKRTINTKTGEFNCRLYIVTSAKVPSEGGTNYSAGQLAVVKSIDKNENITALQHYGQTAASSYGLVDNLTFILNGNPLNRVDDAVDSTPFLITCHCFSV